MVTRVLREPIHIEALANLLRARKLPLTVEITAGATKTNSQNRLQRQWCNDIAQQLGDRTAEDARAFSKLHFGVPILRAESEAYAEKYDRLIRPLPYETKLEYMAVPFDFAVTRAMTTRQLSAYLDAMSRHWSGLGVALTDPDGRAYEGYSR
jgi:hypothetical protein